MCLLINSIFIFLSSSTIRKLLIDSDKEDKLLIDSDKENKLLIDSDKEDKLLIDSDKENIDLNLALWGLPLNGVSHIYIYMYVYYKHVCGTCL